MGRRRRKQDLFDLMAEYMIHHQLRSMKQFADRLPMDPGHFSRVIRGKRPIYRNLKGNSKGKSELQKFAKLCGVKQSVVLAAAEETLRKAKEEESES